MNIKEKQEEIIDEFSMFDDGKLVVQSKDSGAEFSGILEFNDVASATTYTKEKNQNISGKFKMVAEILDIRKSDILYIVEVLANNEIIKVTAVENEIKELKIGDKLLLSSKAFNPILIKI